MNVERFMDGLVVEESGCWGHETISPGNRGYRLSPVSQAPRPMAHRVVYEILRGKIPDGLTLDHLCRNRGCLNPWHLEAVTMRENLLRGETIVAENARKTHCPRGHEYDYTYPDGRRWCRKCQVIFQRRYREERR